MNKLLKNQATLIWCMAVASFILISPKWTVAPAAWLAPAFLLNFVSRVNFKKRLWLGISALFLSGIVSNYGVMPFPLVVFIVMTLIHSVINLIPYLLTTWLAPKWADNWWSTFIFPCALVVIEYFQSFGGGGTWGSIAYTQFENQQLMQIISVGGIWSVTFLIGWFASLLNYAFEKQFKWVLIRKGVTSFALTFLVVLGYGYFRTNSFFERNERSVRVAGITANNVDLLKQMYTNYFGKEISVNSDDLSLNSPELAELQRAFVKFIEDPKDSRFLEFQPKLVAYHDELLKKAEKEARAGARLVVFSEGLFIVTKQEEPSLVQRCIKVARENEVYLTASIAALLPGKIQPGSRFMENKILLINPQGEIESTFFKNKPVPMIEGSIPGDGEVPVTNTPFGKVALSICYDADFPSLMRKAGKQGTDIMMLPSGDWKEISPYHARMAICRAIENGFSLFRMVSGANSVATDYHGNLRGLNDFYDKGERVLVAHLPVSGVKTIYSAIGDVFAWVCILFLAVSGVMSFIKKDDKPTLQSILPDRQEDRTPDFEYTHDLLR